MSVEFKPVPAVYKCFGIIELFVVAQKPLGISAIAAALGYHRSTVFNLTYSLVDLGILERGNDGKFLLGERFNELGKTAGRHSGLVHTARPYLEQINTETGLTAFLGVQSALNAVVVDKADSVAGLKVSTEVGHSLSLLVGAGGKALLSQLPDEELDGILAATDLIQFTPLSCVDKNEFKNIILKVREEGIAVDMEEYAVGVRALAVPLHVSRNIPTAIWAVGLKWRLPDERIFSVATLLKQIAKKIEQKMAD
ncbi:MAG: IclR family transcriptional regulator [Pseudomonadota bacterium]